ncbi:MAG: hypothetical protein ABIZ80_04405, partial [Bryobacteraceae bacterium]
MYFRGVIVLGITLAVQALSQNIITTYAGAETVFRGEGRPAAATGLGDVTSLTIDRHGAVYFADRGNRMVLKFSADGALSIVAGNGVRGETAENVPARDTPLDGVAGMAFDGAGNLYLSDASSRSIRRVTPAGILTTFASGGLLTLPAGLCTDAAGNVYAADPEGHRVFRISASGAISVFAGSGTSGFLGDNGPATQARLDGPSGVAIDAAGNVYIADTNNHRIRRVASGGVISTVAGTGASGFSGDGNALTSPLSAPSGLWLDSAGTLFIADTYNFRIATLSGGRLQTLAGRGTRGFSGDGGPATSASLSLPVAIAADPAGNVYIADTGNRRVRRVSVQRFISTAAGNGTFGGSGDGGPAFTATFFSPAGLAPGEGQSLLIADPDAHRVRRIDASGVISTVAGIGVPGFSGDGAEASRAALDSPTAVAADGNGNIYIADGANGRIRRVTRDGIITTIAGDPASSDISDRIPAARAFLGFPRAMVRDVDGNLYFADAEQRRVRRIGADGIITTVASALRDPGALALDAGGNLYIGDADRVLRLTPSGQTTTVAGGRRGFSGDGGPATLAALDEPRGLAFDRAGNLAIADSANGRIRIVSASGVITTIAGGGLAPNDGSPATLALLDQPSGILFDAAGNLYIAETSAGRIRRVLAASPSFDASPAALNFSARAGGASPAPQNLTISGPLAGPVFQLEVSTRDGGGWLFVNVSSGSLPATAQVFLDTTGLAAGTYQGTIRASVPFSSPPSRTVAVTLVLGDAQPPIAGADPARLSFAFRLGADVATQQVQIANRGGGVLNFQTAVEEGSPWLSVTTSGTSSVPASPALVSVTANPAGLAPGAYTSAFIVTSQGQPPLR